MLASLAALVPALPLAAALWLGTAILFGYASGEIHERSTSRIVLAALGASCVSALILVVARFTGALPDAVSFGRWLSSGNYRVDLVFATDALSLTLAVLASLLCLLVARFAVNYMHREAGFHRLFMVVSLFAAAMALLVLAFFGSKFVLELVLHRTG